MVAVVFRWLGTAYLSAVFLISLTGNSLLCSAMYKNASLRTATNLIILNLAMADIFGSLSNLPIMITTFLTNFEQKHLEAMGDPHFVLTVGSGMAICACHILLCVDRYDSVKRPFHRRLTKAKMKRISMGVWILALTFLAIATAFALLIETHWLFLIDEPSHFIAGEILNGAGILVIIVTLSAMLYSFISVRRGIKSHNQHMLSSLGQATLQTEMRLTKLGVLLVCSFSVTSLPWVTVRLLYSITGHQEKVTFIVCYSMLYTCHAINPLVYASFMRNFRKAMLTQLRNAFCSVFFLCSCRKNMSQVHTASSEGESAGSVNLG